VQSWGEGEEGGWYHGVCGLTRSSIRGRETSSVLEHDYARAISGFGMEGRYFAPKKPEFLKHTG